MPSAVAKRVCGNSFPSRARKEADRLPPRHPLPHGRGSDVLPSIDDRWILRQRGPRNRVDPYRPYAQFVEPECTAEGIIENVATIFLTNKECPYRCLMCDLWKNTTEQRTPDGAIADQIEWALDRLPPAQHVKLYNSGNFFDGRAIPPTDLPRIAELVAHFKTVIIECHPRLIGPTCIDFAESLHSPSETPNDPETQAVRHTCASPALEVAMGLETVDPKVLPRLNKRMTLRHYERATKFLIDHGIAVRAFILLRTPFQSEDEGLEWAKRSIDYAYSIGVTCCAIIPTRSGNGAMEWLQQRGLFAPPIAASIETVVEYGVSLQSSRAMIDLWDIEKFFPCPRCRAARCERLRQINLSQQVPPPITCDCSPVR